MDPVIPPFIRIARKHQQQHSLSFDQSPLLNGPKNLDFAAATESAVPLEVLPSMLNMPDKKPTIGHLLEHPITFEIVKDACARHLCVEMPMFALHVQKFRRLKRRSEMDERARQIVDTFFVRDAPHELNLEYSRKARVIEAVRAGHVETLMFDDAERDVLDLISANVMRELKSSGLYALCVRLVNSHKESMYAFDTLKEYLDDSRRDYPLSRAGTSYMRSRRQLLSQ